MGDGSLRTSLFSSPAQEREVLDMAGRIARTQTALRVADFLAPREGKAHLSEYGWSPGVPIVMTRATESVEDAMGMVSIHSRACSTRQPRICACFMSPPRRQHLKRSGPRHRAAPWGDLFEQLGSALIIELRVKFWHHTAVAHIIPSCPAMMNGHDSWASSFSRTAQPLATSAPAAAPAPP